MHTGQTFSQFQEWFKTQFQPKSQETCKEMFDGNFSASKDTLDAPQSVDYMEEGETEPTFLILWYI